ncbi:formimidoylglutamase [Halobacillus yeomjeoni]|uniref:formimidoylglutamase n=1 Tax=Halobacillus yeomjeoni TaxID=311194 RepID=UPI001CD6A4FF|nr:formimidoylglutamase [Halobacillus yeomjeoni]MCA0985532.1 formimidoylglutamase [Halobacillus yeomjeoni]
MSFQFLNPKGDARFKDRHTTKVDETRLVYEEGMEADIGVIGLPSSKSSISMSLAAEAPKTIRAALRSFSTYSGEKNHDFADVLWLDFGDVEVHPTDLKQTLQRLNQSVSEMLDTNSCDRYIMLGGDHGVSFPSISAFHKKYGRIGVIQWDAHHDLRNLEDGGRTNGTPFRSLIESGVLLGKDLVQVGIRDYSNAKAYSDYAKEKGVKVYSMGDVDLLGANSIVSDEVKRLSEHVDMIYLSVDMDAVDQAFAPGCPAVGPGGLTSRELLASVAQAAAHPKVKAMDIVEVDPSKDVRDITSRLAAHVMMRFMYEGSL